MTKYLLGVLFLIPLASSAFTYKNCDLTRFRWGCEIPIQARPTHHFPSMINCHGTNVYVTRDQYLEIMRYQRANVGMALEVNDEYVTSPCVPAGYYPKFNH